MMHDAFPAVVPHVSGEDIANPDTAFDELVGIMADAIDSFLVKPEYVRVKVTGTPS